MARFYSNENFAKDVVDCLRGLGHDVLTSLEAGNANKQIDDLEVLRFATCQQRVVVTYNRRDFLRLHNRGIPHAGIVLCTFDPYFERQAKRINDSMTDGTDLANQILRVYQPAK